MKHIFFPAALCCMLILAGCEGSPVTPKSSISDCNPNLDELKTARHMKAAVVDDPEVVSKEDYLFNYSEILTVRCTGDKQMQIIRHDPNYVCCMTPQSSIIRTGYTITMNSWDIGTMPCDCECPRNVECTLNGIPYGTYTFSLKHEHKEIHSVDLDFVPELDTMIVWKKY